MATQQYPIQQAPPPQSYPLQGQPPSYVGQPESSCQLQTVASAEQTTVAITGSAEVPQTANSCLTLTALMLSIITVITCGATIVFLPCIVPGFILAIVAAYYKGKYQATNATISIGLNIAMVVCCIMVLVIMLPLTILSAHRR